jgi:hypothetical protein
MSNDQFEDFTTKRFKGAQNENPMKGMMIKAGP